MLDDAIDQLLTALERNPLKNGLTVLADLETGRRPSVPPLTLGRMADDWLSPPKPEAEPAPKLSPVEELANVVRGMLNPLEMENPLLPVLGLGVGTVTAATAFGVEVDTDPEHRGNLGGPKCHLPLEHFDDFPVPDVNTAGLFPQIRERIDFYCQHLPPEIKISLPDLQGPFNIAHILLGTKLFYHMVDDPARVRGLLGRITDFLIQCFDTIPQWIGEERSLRFIGSSKRIAECSVNLISREHYREFVLPCDLRLAEHFGEIAIHPCSGPHVFEETLDNLPNVRYTECGVIDCAFAGSIDVDGALRKIGGRPVILSCGEELKEGREERTIRDHFSRLEDHDLMSFGYSGMYWTRNDDADIAALHRKLDEVYMSEYAE